MRGGLHKCVICGMKFIGYGNNAEPLKEGICCDGCNILVIKYRIKLSMVTSPIDKAKIMEELNG